MRLINADVLIDGYEDNYEFCEAVNNTPTVPAIPIPENATNGDMITTLFPFLKVERTEYKYSDTLTEYYVSFESPSGVGKYFYVKASWWDAPYKRGE